MLGRDRAGEKPVYWTEAGGELLFASEIKALLAHPRVSRETDVQAITRYLLYGYFPAPHTPFLGIRKLPAGHLLIAESGKVRLEPYWDLRAEVTRPLEGPPPDEPAAIEEVRRLVREAVIDTARTTLGP